MLVDFWLFKGPGPVDLDLVDDGVTGWAMSIPLSFCRFLAVRGTGRDLTAGVTKSACGYRGTEDWYEGGSERGVDVREGGLARVNAVRASAGVGLTCREKLYQRLD